MSGAKSTKKQNLIMIFDFQIDVYLNTQGKEHNAPLKYTMLIPRYFIS